MKKYLVILIISIIVFAFNTAFTTIKTAEVTLSDVAPSVATYCTVLDEENVFTLDLKKSFLGFKEAVGFKESQGKYTRINSLGYLGKYQFGASTLAMYRVTNLKSFLHNAQLQERVFEMNCMRNKWILRKDIKRFVGKRINGVLVTESGILAAAHLSGAGGVKKYLRSYGKKEATDAYGATISYYLKKFGGYDTSSVLPVKLPKL